MDDPQVMTLEEYQKLDLGTKRRGNKHHAIRTEVDGIMFDSKREAARYGELKMRQAAGEIQNLETHTSYDLRVNEQLICRYEADFRYIENGSLIVEDVKSKTTRTRAYRIKNKLMKAIHKIEVLEVE